MDEAAGPSAEQQGRDWWRSAIIDMSPGVIRYRGYAVQDLITQGVGLNGAMASAINVLGDVHGGAGEQALALYGQVAVLEDAGCAPDDAVRKALAEHVAAHGKAIPGFGHRFHPVDPRSAPLLARVDAAQAAGVVSGRHARIARAVEAELARTRSRPVPMNIDGATAVIYGELGFQPPLARGLFCLSRAVGALAHAWEQTQQGGRIKGPLPRAWTPSYDGPPPRPVPPQGEPQQEPLSPG